MNAKLLVQQIQRYHNRTLLIDTNLLLLFFVGSFRPDLIKSFKRMSEYSLQDFEILEALLLKFKRFSTTPHILTEVSNFMGQRGEPERSEMRCYLAKSIQAWHETNASSKTLALTSCFPQFGLTDAAIADLVPGTCLVLTDDDPLAGLLKKRGSDVIRFSDLQKGCR